MNTFELLTGWFMVSVVVSLVFGNAIVAMNGEAREDSAKAQDYDSSHSHVLADDL